MAREGRLGSGCRALPAPTQHIDPDEVGQHLICKQLAVPRHNAVTCIFGVFPLGVR